MIFRFREIMTEAVYRRSPSSGLPAVSGRFRTPPASTMGPPAILRSPVSINGMALETRLAHAGPSPRSSGRPPASERFGVTLRYFLNPTMGPLFLYVICDFYFTYRPRSIILIHGFLSHLLGDGFVFVNGYYKPLPHHPLSVL